MQKNACLIVHPVCPLTSFLKHVATHHAIIECYIYVGSLNVFLLLSLYICFPFYTVVCAAWQINESCTKLIVNINNNNYDDDNNNMRIFYLFSPL